MKHVRKSLGIFMLVIVNAFSLTTLYAMETPVSNNIDGYKEVILNPKKLAKYDFDFVGFEKELELFKSKNSSFVFDEVSENNIITKRISEDLFSKSL